MNKMLVALTAVWLGLLLCAQSTFAATTVPGMGVDYFFYDLGSYNPNVPASWPNNDWYNPGQNVKTPIGLYQLMPSKVDTQISNMRASGMDYVVLLIQMSDLTPCKTEAPAMTDFLKIGCGDICWTIARTPCAPCNRVILLRS